MASSCINQVVSTGEEASVSSDQNSEVASIRSTFPARCRVVCDAGEFSNVVTVQPENFDVTIKFQLTNVYPSVIPKITIRSESLTEENIIDVQQVLRSKAHDLIGHPMILALIQEAEIQLKTLGLKPGKVVMVKELKNLDKKPGKNKKPKQKPKGEEEEEGDKKLPSMKTADDVIKRVIWDSALDKDDFLVGYIDRFKGLVEQNFSDFSWENLAAVDNDVLAIPRHRIQYFKYKDVKVWDKSRRIDNVFGSADGTKTIDVVMKEVQEALGGGEAQSSNAKEESSSNDDDENDSNDEDGTGYQWSCHDNQEANEGGLCQEEGASASPGTDYKARIEVANTSLRDKLRPNYFICVRVTNEAIIDKIGNIQDSLMKQDPLFGECCIPGAALHVTLTTVALNTPAQILQCTEVLKAKQADLLSALPTTDLKIQGVSNFSHRVLYAQMQYTDAFLQFCDLLKRFLHEAGVSLTDENRFEPHVTIMKITRPVSKLRRTKHIDPHLYSKFTDLDFGNQRMDSIYLCSMGKERREDGFYITPVELHFKN